MKKHASAKVMCDGARRGLAIKDEERKRLDGIKHKNISTHLKRQNGSHRIYKKKWNECC